MKILLLLTSLLSVPTVGIAESNNGKNSVVKISDMKKLRKLTNGYYVLEKYVNRKEKTYSTAEGFEAHPIYGEFEVENTNSKTGLKGGNFREGLVFFNVLKNGSLSGSPCFERFCISEINPIDESTFVIMVNGKAQKFVCTEGLKPLEW